MPELPEVESLRRGLVRAGLQEPIERVWRSALPLRIGAHWQQEHVDRLQGGTPGEVRRRGKYLIWDFHRGSSTLGLLVHLGMSGKLLVCPRAAPMAPHTHLVLDFADGREVRFVDPRRFGGLRVDTLEALLVAPPLCELGPEPFDPAFGGAHLQAAAGASVRCLRDVLLDQRVVAGVGNIYAVEALFHAGLHPLLAARRLKPSAWQRLAEAVRWVLEQGIRNGGTTFRDYRNAEGEAGRNQSSLMVYGRAGEPCHRCGTVLLGFAQGGRSGVYCARDQPRPKTRWVA